MRSEGMRGTNPSRPPFRTGIIGCGYIGSLINESSEVTDIYSHAAAYTFCPATQLAAVCDIDPNRARKSGRRWEVKSTYTDYRTMLAEEPLDIVSICTPDETHYEIVQAVLRSGRVRAVLCEKPLATDVARGWELVSLADECGVILSVNYSRRLDDGHQRARDLILGGGIGSIQAVRGLYTKGIVHNGTHFIDTLRFLTGQGIDAVMAYRPRPVPPDDLAVDAVLWLEDGTLAVLQSCHEDHYAVFELDILGTLGRVSITESGHLIVQARPMDSDRYPGYRELGGENVISNEMNGTTLGVVENIVESLSSETLLQCTAWDAATDLAIASDIKSSARNDCRMDVSKIRGVAS